MFPILYHWSPALRHPDIAAGGLRLHQAPTVSTRSSPYLYAGCEPRLAWALSGGMPHCAHVDLWDLWMIHISSEDTLYMQPGAGPTIHEVKIANDVPADRCWYVGCRQADGAITR